MLRTASIRANPATSFMSSLPLQVPVPLSAPFPGDSESFQTVETAEIDGDISPPNIATPQRTQSGRRPIMLHSISTDCSVKFKHCTASRGGLFTQSRSVITGINASSTSESRKRRAAKAILMEAAALTKPPTNKSTSSALCPSDAKQHPQQQFVYFSADEEEEQEMRGDLSTRPSTFVGVTSAELVQSFNQPCGSSGTVATSSQHKILLLDLRDPSDYARSHIHGAVSTSCASNRLKMRRIIHLLISSRLSSSSPSASATTENQFTRPAEVVLYSGQSVQENQQSLFDLICESAGSVNHEAVKALLGFLYANFVRIRFLTEDFNSFQTQYPWLCSNANNTKMVNGLGRLAIASDDKDQPQNRESKRGQFSKMRNFKTIDNFHDIYSAKASRIFPFLYLGNEQDALDERFLQENHITHILNVTKTSSFFDEQKYRCKRISVADTLNQDLYSFFEEAIEFIEEVRLNNGSVLVHCQAGVSRSATIILAYLLKHSNISNCKNFQDCLQLVKTCRPIVSPNFAFMGQLNRFESELKKFFIKEENSQLLTNNSDNATLSGEDAASNLQMETDERPTKFSFSL